MGVYKQFSETQIRPDGLMANHAEMLQKDRDFVLEHADSFVEVTCPACDSSNYEHKFDKAKFAFVTCTDCDTVYLNPRPTPEILMQYHQNSVVYDYWNEHVFPASEEARRKYLYKPRLQRILDLCKEHSISKPSLAEVGAGFGTFCEEAMRSNKFENVLAIEPSPFLAKSCKKKGLDVIEAPIEQVDKFEKPVNVIASFEVIEHLFAPRDFTRKCFDLLAPGGLVIFTCPNIHGFDMLVLQTAHDQVEFEHLNYFNPKSLGLMMEKCGFEILESLTPGRLDAELVRKKMISGEYNSAHDHFLRHLLIDRWEELGAKFQNFLADNQLSSHLWVIARKPA